MAEMCFSQFWGPEARDRGGVSGTAGLLGTTPFPLYTGLSSQGEEAKVIPPVSLL